MNFFELTPGRCRFQNLRHLIIAIVATGMLTFSKEKVQKGPYQDSLDAGFPFHSVL